MNASQWCEIIKTTQNHFLSKSIFIAVLPAFSLQPQEHLVNVLLLNYYYEQC